MTQTEYAFHGILVAEVTKLNGVDAVDKETGLKIKRVVQKLVLMMDEATQIIDFFDKWDEVRRVKKNIKRAINDEFNQDKLIKPVTDRFMELAQVKFR